MSKPRQVPNQTASGTIDDDSTRTAQALQAGGAVRGLPDDRIFRCLASSDPLTYYRQSSCDTDTYAQRLAFDRRGRDSLDYGQGRAYRLLRVRLSSSGPAEVDQDSVTHVLRNETVKSDNGFGDTALVRL
jgi:hypothetical protein